MSVNSRYPKPTGASGRPAMMTAGRRRQAGLSLMETMIAMAVGLVVTAAMISMMANTMGSGTRTIEMSRLQQDMRAAMQLITRDVRRSAYNAEAILCFGNLDCGADGTFPNGLAGDLVLFVCSAWCLRRLTRRRRDRAGD